MQRYPRFLRFQKLLYNRSATQATCLLSTSAADKRPLKTIEDMPGHRDLFGFGSGIQLFSAMITTKKPIGKLALEGQFIDVEKFGPIYKVYIPGIKMVHLADPVEVARVLRNEPKYPKRFDIPVFDYYRELRKTVVPGVFFANGEDWYRYRSTVSKRILKPREVAEHVPVFNDIITDFIARLDSIQDPAGTDTEYQVKDFDNELFKWSFESVAHVLFDRRFRCLDNEVNPQAQDFIKSVGALLSSFMTVSLLPVWFYKIYETNTFKDFVYHFDNMYKYADIFINEKLEELESKGSEKEQENCTEEKVGFVEYLLFRRKLSKNDLMASIIDLLFAGVDTTSNTMQWFLYLMAKNQDKQTKLFQEITQSLEKDELPNSETLAKMPYLKACIKETLRMYPVLSQTSRIIPTEMEILGYHLPKGTQVQFLSYYMSRSEHYFQNANDFVPERWLREEKREVVNTVQAFASIPFGFGTRMCAGRRIAEMELYLLATRLIQKYNIQYPDDEIVEPFLRGVTIPDRPLRVKFIERQNNM